MLLGDLIFNDEFDINCNFKVYIGQWNDGGKLVWSTKQNGFSKPDCSLLDKHINYLTVDTTDPSIVIEIED